MTIPASFKNFSGLFLTLFFFHASFISDAQVKDVIVELNTDDFPHETSVKLINGNTFEEYLFIDGRNLEPNVLVRDTIRFDSIIPCLRLEIVDSGKDGFSGNGKITLFDGDTELTTIKHFTESEDFVVYCRMMDVCESPKSLFEGSVELTGKKNYWFRLFVFEPTFYSIRTISNCDTKLWIYDNCDFVHPDDQTGAIFFNDDLDDKNAGIAQIKLNVGSSYFVRIEVDDSCESAQMDFVNLELREGCMDSEACNFDPLANLPSGNCIYDDCFPDLIVNGEVLRESLFLDSIMNSNECLIEEGCLSNYGKRYVLKFTTQLENIGEADYIVGSPEEDSPLFSEDNCHQHWHYLGYAEYLLFDGDGVPLPIGIKNGFCALDYQCNSANGYKYDCDYMGISAGCLDVYESDLLCQWIDITDVAEGEYTFVVRVNYNRSPDLFGRKELNYENNWSQVCISISKVNGRPEVRMLDDCAAYRDCMNVPFGNNIPDCEGICGGSAHFGDLNGNGELDSLDISELFDKMMDGALEVTSCFDLDQSGHYSIYDIALMRQCLAQQENAEVLPTHQHCNFPVSILSIIDSVDLFIENLDLTEQKFDLYYLSSSEITGVDVNVSGVDIEQIAPSPLISEGDVRYNGKRVVLDVSETTTIPKTAFGQKLITVYFSEITEIELCLDTINAITNDRYEKVVASKRSGCLGLELTTTVESIEQSNWKVHPNPVKDELFIKYTLGGEHPRIRVYNTLGEIVISETVANDVVNVKYLTSGAYICHVLLGTEEYSFSLIKL